MTEELRAVVEILGTISGDATLAVITYFLLTGLVPLLTTIIHVTGGYYALKLVTGLFYISVEHSKDTKNV